MTNTRKVNAHANVGTLQQGDVVLGERVSGTTVLFTIPDLAAGGGGAVDSVNGQTGVVVLSVEDLNGATLTTTELNYVDGVTSAIQTQIDSKAPDLGVDDNYVTDAEKVKLSNLSGTNTGDQTITLTGNVTGSGTGSFAATIANSAVTLAKQADVATSTVFYRKTAGTGAPEVNTLATLKTDLGLTNTNSGDQNLFSTIVVSGQSNVVADSATDILTLVAGTNVTITTNGTTDTITIAASGGGGGMTMNTASGTTQAAAVNNGYITTNASQCNVTLPATCAVGDLVFIAGQGAGGWKVTGNTGQTIQIGSAATSSAGSAASANRYDTIKVVCIVANTTWSMASGVSSGYTIL